MYLILNSEGRKRFLELLARDFDVNNQAVEDTIARRLQSTDPEERRN